MKRIDWSRLMIRKYATCALIELMQIGKTPSSTAPVLQHAPEAFNRVEMMPTVGRQERQPKLLMPVGQCRGQFVCPMDATAVDDHHALFRGVAKKRHQLMAILTTPVRIQRGDNLVADFGGAILDRAKDAAQPPAGDPAPGAIADPRLAFEALVAFDLTLAQRPGGQASAPRCAPPAGPRQGAAPENRCILIEQNDLTPAGPVLEGREFERRPRQLSGVRSEPSRGPAVADVFFLTRRGRSRG